MVSLDRFAQGFVDRNALPAVAECDACGKEIYPGEEVYVLADGQVIHAADDCLHLAAGVIVADIEDVLGGRWAGWRAR